MRVRRENLEIRVGDVPTVQIRRRRRDADIEIGEIAARYHKTATVKVPVTLHALRAEALAPLIPYQTESLRRVPYQRERDRGIFAPCRNPGFPVQVLIVRQLWVARPSVERLKSGEPTFSLRLGGRFRSLGIPVKCCLVPPRPMSFRASYPTVSPEGRSVMWLVVHNG